MEPLQFVEQELQLISKLFNQQKALNPMVVLVKGDKRYLIPAVYNNTAQKDIVSQGIKDLVKKAEPDIVIYVAEAWMVSIPQEEIFKRIISPSKSPDKVEIVVVQIEFKTGEKFTQFAKINRNGIQVILDDFKAAGTDLSAGRFMDFFPPTKLN